MEPGEQEQQPISLDPPDWVRRVSPVSRAEVVAAAIGISIVILSWGVWWVIHQRDTAEPPSAEPWAVQYGARVAVNRAEWQELLVVPGVGEKTAARIVYERQANGPYKDLEDLIVRVGRLPRERLSKFAAHLDFGSDLPREAGQSSAD